MRYMLAMLLAVGIGIARQSGPKAGGTTIVDSQVCIVVSAGDKLTQIAELELTHPQQRYHPDLFRSGGDDITYAGRQDGEAAAGVARRGRIHS